MILKYRHMPFIFCFFYFLDPYFWLLFHATRENKE